MPTIEIKSIKPGGGGDYTTLNAWYTAEVTNLVTADKIKIAEVYGGGNCLSGQLQMTGWTTDATRFVIIRAADGEEHHGIYDETKAYGSVTGGNQAAIENRANYTRIIGMQLKTDGSSTSPPIHQQSQCQGTLVDKCILIATGGTDSAVRISGGGGTAPHVVRNNVVIATSSSSVVSVIGVAGVGVLHLFNNTIIGGTGALSSVNSGTITSNNNYLKATTIYGGATYFDKSNDATSNTEASNPTLDSVAYSTANFVSVTAGAEDLHLVQGSILVDNGRNLSASGVTYDFTNQGRIASFDIGADELDLTPTSIGGYLLAEPGDEISAYIGGYLLADATPKNGIIGGYLLAKSPPGNANFGIFGGYMLGEQGSSKSASIGGYLLGGVVRNTDAVIGGYVDSKHHVTGVIGGYLFGVPDYTEDISTRARTLVAVTSEDIVDQALSMDAKIVLKGIFQQSFGANLINTNTINNNFGAELDVEKFKIPPTVRFISIERVAASGEVLPSGQPFPNFDSNGARHVCVVASGELGDGNQFISAHIDFGDPFDRLGGYTQLLSVSGFTGPPVWSGCHDYSISGQYVITIRAQDDQGMVGMAASGLNLASGAMPGIHYPLISISGTPRFGEVPPSLEVSFNTISSGIFVPPYTNRQYVDSLVKFPTDERILWSFGNRERSVRRDPKTFYNSPGTFAPVLRYLYTNPSGYGPFVLSDTLMVGFNF